jgi:hypothetical protein
MEMSLYRMRMEERTGRRTVRTARGRRPIITGTKNVNHKVTIVQDHGNDHYRMRMGERMGRRTVRRARGRSPIITGTKNVNHKVSRAQDHVNGCLQDEDGVEDAEEDSEDSQRTETNNNWHKKRKS